jgi:hypothetical protein
MFAMNDLVEKISLFPSRQQLPKNFIKKKLFIFFFTSAWTAEGREGEGGGEGRGGEGGELVRADALTRPRGRAYVCADACSRPHRHERVRADAWPRADGLASARARTVLSQVTSKMTLQCVQVTDAPAAIVRPKTSA